jgi:cellulose synthase/poly-beta-1,6-N-acetylglucosamine synthase-like glycosyltransferase
VSRWIWLAAGLLLGADWLRRAIGAAIGMGNLADVTRPEWDRFPRLTGAQPRVSVVVPARDEGNNIEQCLRSLLNQDYPEVEICAVDDRSSDDTGAIMDRLQRESPGKLDVIHIGELPSGWLGKTHAMWRGGAATDSDWILFTDGDIMFRSDALRRTLNYAELTACDHLVIFPTLIMKTCGERMMLAFFGLASSLLLRPWKVRDPKARDFIGAGAFSLIRRSAYEALGTYRALRMEVIDDLRLGQSVKQHGFVQDCVRGPSLVQLRWAEGAFGVVRNLQKNMFSLLRFNWGLVLLASIAATIYHLGPWVGLVLVPGVAKAGFALALCAIALLYARITRQFDVPFWYVFTHPVAALMFVYTLLNSAVSSVVHGGVMWRGTTYSIDEIRLATAQGKGTGDRRRRG